MSTLIKSAWYTSALWRARRYGPRIAMLVRHGDWHPTGKRVLVDTIINRPTIKISRCVKCGTAYDLASVRTLCETCQTPLCRDDT